MRFLFRWVAVAGAVVGGIFAANSGYPELVSCIVATLSYYLVQASDRF